VIKAAFFDAGETLVYRNPSLAAITIRHIKSRGIKRSGEEVRRALKASALLMAKTVKGAKLSDSLKWEEYMGYVSKALGIKSGFGGRELSERLKTGSSFRAYSDAVYALKHLRKKGIRTGVISNAASSLKGIIERTGLLKLLDYLIISEVVGIEKPDPAIFRLALKKAGVKPEEAVYTGDNYLADIEGAAGAGIRPYWLLRRTDNAQFRFEGGKINGSTIKIRNLKQLIKKITG